MPDLVNSALTPAVPRRAAVAKRRVAAEAPAPVVPAPGETTDAGGDRLATTRRLPLDSPALRRAAERATADAEAERIVSSLAQSLPDLDGRAPGLPAPVAPPYKPAFEVESVRFADRLAGGREATIWAGQDPHQAGASMAFMQTDPRTGRTDLALKEASFRTAVNGYDLFWSLGENGRPRFNRLEKNGQTVQGQLVDALKAKIQERPELYKPLVGAVLVGAVVAAHAYAAKSGRPVSFDALNLKLYGTDGLEVRGRLKAAITGEKRVVQASGAQIDVNYQDSKLQYGTSVRYYLRGPEHPTAAWELSSSLSYAYSPNLSLVGSAFVNPKDHNRGVFVGIEGSF